MSQSKGTIGPGVGGTALACLNRLFNASANADPKSMVGAPSQEESVKIKKNWYLRLVLVVPVRFEVIFSLPLFMNLVDYM